MNKALMLTILYFLGAHLLTWFQLNGQFFIPWFKNNAFILCLFGVPISWLYIEATRYGFIAFDELIWPARLIGFGLGILSFAVCANIYLGEPITLNIFIGGIISLFAIYIINKE